MSKINWGDKGAVVEFGEDSVTGVLTVNKNINGVPLATTTGAAGPSKDRVIALSAVTTAQDITYASGQEPTSIQIACKGGTDVMKVCINAPTTAARDSYLAQVGDATTPLMHRRIVPGDPIEKRVFTVAPGTKISRVSYLPTTNHTEIEVLGV